MSGRHPVANGMQTQRPFRDVSVDVVWLAWQGLLRLGICVRLHNMQQFVKAGNGICGLNRVR